MKATKKKLSFSKQNRLKKIEAGNIIILLRSYTLEQWLRAIRKLNIEYDKNNELIRAKPEFLVVGADLALKVARNNENNNLPTEQECYALFNAEINLSEGRQSLIKVFGIGGTSFLAAWQNRFHYTPANMVGRMLVLYEAYNEKLLEFLGVSIEDMYLILMLISGMYQNEHKYYFKKEDLILEGSEYLSEEKISNFLNSFSITQKEYQEVSKSEKIYEKSFGRFKFLIRYPIIETSDDKYTIPVYEQLLDTLSNNLYFTLLENYAKIGSKDSKTFMDEFGLVLENYVLDLARERFKRNQLVDANKIVRKNSELRCEAVIIHKKQALAIEVKKMYFRRDDIDNMDKVNIDKLLKNHIVKAFKQIENTLSYIRYKSNYGLIVIPDIMIGLEAIKSYIVEKYKDEAQFNSNTFLCTLSFYEALMANDDDAIFEILETTKSRDFSEGTDIIMVMLSMKDANPSIQFANSLLVNKRDELLKKAVPSKYIEQ
ncbi:hypothetical protein [Sulfurimonas sp.]|uniref:hypothetical protein n=1 Tax=Sulfurimonas sp. TaxID=2022749 RepID=UPI0019FF63C8|nr:hypothetical protein [Sulfurimonas sp.]MBE0515492.1 hypothetical protein [Sulfurimonas sp.]